ncbi:MAG TPA: MFS transporter [Longimicrobium sp.]|nr:MFS transporter [Longimicrobium sp.]
MDVAEPVIIQRSTTAGAERAARRREWVILAVLAAVNFCHIVDFVLVMPLGPQLMRGFAITPREFGLIVSAYTFSAAVSGLLAASVMDRFDRKRALLVLLAGFGVGTLACAFAPTYPVLVAARVLAGAFGGVLAGVVFTVIGDEIAPERRGTATGIVMAGFSAASILGLPMGLWFAARAGWHAPFLALAAITGGVLAFAILALPPMRGHLSAERRPPWTVIGEVARQPAHLRAFALSVMLMFGGFTISPFISPYLVANVGVKEEELSFVYLAGGIVTLVVSPLVGRLSDRFGHLRAFTVAALVSTLPIVAVTNLPRVPLAAALAVTTSLTLGFSSRMVPSMALITGSVEPRLRGAFMSVNASLQQMGAGVASFAAGLIVGGSGETGITRFPVVGAVAAVATLLALPLAARLHAARPPRPVAEIGESAPAAATH